MERRIKGVLSPKASGSITITENGNYDVVDVANAIVNVVPEEVGGITPEGSITLTSNGVYDVTMYAEAVVDVENVIPEGYVKPSGTLNVTSNGTYDVTEKKNVSVNVPQPSGTIEITENGVVDVTNYANANVNVASSGGGVKALLDVTQSCAGMFQNKNTLTSIDGIFSFSDTENVTDMSNMFKECRELTSIPQLDTSNVTNMNSIFYNCRKLISVPLLDTSNVTDMAGMFSRCGRLLKIDITSLDNIASVSNMSSFALDCYSLTKVIIRTMSKIPLLQSNSFNNCYHFTGTTNVTYNPNGLKDGRIYVPDEYVEQLKVATNWSQFADIIVPLSTLEE